MFLFPSKVLPTVFVLFVVKVRPPLSLLVRKIYLTYTFSFPVRRKIVVAKQNYRCAGCGTRIDPGILCVFVVLENVTRHLSFKMHFNLFPYVTVSKHRHVYLRLQFQFLFCV